MSLKVSFAKVLSMSPKFPKSHRVRRGRDFARLYGSGRVFQDEFFRIHYGASENPAQPGRLGLAVGRSLGKAVQRNRIKRLLREVFRHHPELTLGLDLVVQPITDVAALKNPQIREVFLKTLKNLRSRVHR
jgi:ribonuclease P protein component